MENLKIVAIGGGTGISILLRGLKEITENITAIVSVADDGGGSGVLREDLGMLPPGDIRSNILALANTEPIMEELLKYRFDSGKLQGQNFGNLLIAALLGISGNFEEAIKNASEIFAITGKVIPVTTEEMHLCCELENGRKIIGESAIPREVLKQGSSIKKVYLSDNTIKPLKSAIDEIMKADIVFLGPGSLYTSLLANILIEEIDLALSKTKAKKIFIANLMTQPGETDSFGVKEHISAFYKHSKYKYIDYIFVNNGNISDQVIKKYKEEGSLPVKVGKKDIDYLKKFEIELLEGDVVEEKKGYLRHDSKKMSKLICDYLVNVVETKIEILK
ncbi:gluconeogenesis factor YvcK family protein [Helicovermis profundi]|uniref:Putative gluconeogenesis factor n=1 Tax=Helicovermis profundi TaxID=3065157 RepID=A0AAU9EQV3_9FIRM|nr:YvcK family protein [Clostridia bacterium S502]